MQKDENNHLAVWGQYQKGAEAKAALGLYEKVKQNEDFYNGVQWRGVDAPDLPKPVFNFLKPAVNYYIAMLISDDIAVSAKVEKSAETVKAAKTGYSYFENASEADVPEIIKNETDHITEQTDLKFLNRRLIRNCAVDGDCALYIRYDTEGEGEIKAEIINNTDVYPGDMSRPEIETQPYIILASRRLLSEVRKYARSKGANFEITSDDGEYGGDESDEYATVLLKFWKENGCVFMTETVKNGVIVPPVDTGYTRYPLCWMNWESVKGSFHGVSPLTSAIPNQIFVNKLFAMAMISVQNSAFPKILYNRAKIDSWDGRPGRDVAVSGDPTQAVFQAFRAPEMSEHVARLIDSTIKYTKDLMGASDAALGNVKPDNTSAIVATQKAAGLPLDIQRLDFYNFLENAVRIFVDIMRAKYGVRFVTLKNGDGSERRALFDFSSLGKLDLRLNVEIGQSAYWSELTQIKTLDNLMDRNIIPDAQTYLEALPNGYVKNKEAILKKLSEYGENAALSGETNGFNADRRGL